MARSREELVSLFPELYPRLVRLAFLLTSDMHVAEDLAQDAFAQAWRTRDTVRDPAAYVRGVVVRLAARHHRRRLLARRVSPLVAVVHATSDLEARIALERAIERLPARQRACVVLRYYEDLTEADTAHALGVSVGTVKSQTHKALRRLRAALEESK